MNATGQSKIINAGFTIIRERSTGLGDPQKLDIYAKTKTRPDWFLYEGSFLSKAARLRRIKELLTDPMIVED